MCKKQLTFVMTALLLCGQFLLAQERTITGVVTDAEDGMPLPGVNVVVRGTSSGASTDFNGLYSLRASDGDILVFSSMGYISKEVPVSGRDKIDITLASDTQELEGVVVTALGIRRETKSLGYSLQEVKGTDLVEARENNLANTLTGKVAGVQIVRGSSGPASSSKIVLRGNNSLTGDNQPLIVVDGVPMDNFAGAENNDFWNPDPDMGSGIGDINPENIESMSVLKGASAAALYGSRAGNGVILITTKTGRRQDGLGITYSITTGFESIFISPELQNKFGQGEDGIYNQVDGASWGPEIGGQTVTKWNGEEAPLRAYNNLDNYFRTGINVKHNLSFQQQISDGTSLYSSVSYLDDKSQIPGSSLKRLNLLTRAVSYFGKDNKWSTDAKVQYIRSDVKNRPFNGVNDSNAFSTMYTLPSSLDIRDFEGRKDEDGNMVWYQPGNSVNPYWAAKYNLNQDLRDRFLLNGAVKYSFTDWLNAEVRAGADLYTTNTERKVYAGSPIPTNYSLGKNTFIESNYSVLVSAAKDDIIGKLGGAVTVGGNLMRQERSGLSANSGELRVPDLFSLNNGVDRPTVNQTFTEKKINSVYGTFQVNYDGYAFIDFTARNDWSSTLHKDNRSYFYPSVSTSLVVSDMILQGGGDLPEWFSFFKVRGSYAQVGNDMGPYQLYNFYSIGTDPNGNTVAGRNTTLFDPTVKNELIKSWEAGFDLRLLNNRIGIDFSWYKSNATNQLIALPLNPLSGYENYMVNAGDIENKGIEVMVNARILDNPDGFNWDMNINYSTNDNTVNSLTEEVSQYRLGGFDNVAILAVSGQPYGEIWGTRYQRVQDESSPHFGKIVVDEQGIPLASDESVRLGNQQADALLGISNTFRYKDLSLSFLVDARFGGEIYSGTNRAIQNAGTGAATVVNGAREDIVFDGVVADGSGGYAQNSAAVSPQLFWRGITERSGNLGITEANIYDATNIRLRNVSLNYNLPSEWLSTMSIQRAQVGISCNNVWMIKSHLEGIDPESVFATGTNAVGFENLTAPTSRTFFVNLSLSF
ncbi:SusC/RagA family TonB-linked outer membrane protein [Sinomicrobium soli]|nr:SusC/RagA family TonB-linked outer membrane protein [Sinomicrobium sp. N-1-3-6]